MLAIGADVKGLGHGLMVVALGPKRLNAKAGPIADPVDVDHRILADGLRGPAHVVEENPRIQAAGGVGACDSCVAGHVSAQNYDAGFFQPRRKDVWDRSQRRLGVVRLAARQAVEVEDDGGAGEAGEDAITEWCGRAAGGKDTLAVEAQEPNVQGR